MTIRNLEYLFRPRSIAVFGASDRAGSVGATVLRNLIAGGFAGPIYPVNLRHSHVAGRRAFRDAATLPETPDLAVIATPPSTVPGIISALGARGTRAAVVLTAGLAAAIDGQGKSLTQAMLEASRPHLLRILGPNCVGLLVPGLGINASFAHTSVSAGQLAFVSQSGGLTTAVLDWAHSRGIGFSHFISLGDAADVDFGDVLDYLASDPATRAILLYIESIRGARKFMSAARAAARNKPVLVVKAGRVAEGARAAASHTGALAGSDAVYDAAIRRAGMLRVDTVLELFDAVETLGRARSVAGDRLAIMTNGGGPGVMATDALVLGGGKLATLSTETTKRLDQLLPSTWSHGNPVDIIGDAPAQRYAATLDVLLDEPGADVVLLMHVPTAIVPAVEIARACASACAPTLSGARVLSCWLGGDGLDEARDVFEAAGIPTYATPERAVAAFLQLVNYRRNQESLMQIPGAATASAPDIAAARTVIQEALTQGRELLSEPVAKRVLSAYGIPVVQTVVASDAADAARIAEQIGFPVALKIISPQVTHKSDVGGVALGLSSTAEVRDAAEAMARRLREHAPNAELVGFSVQQMVRRPRAVETIVGATVDATFGPIILFGQGGVAVEVIGDRAVGLPPLNLALAKELVSRTRIARLLEGYRDRPPADREALYLTLVRVSQLVTDLPEVVELDINPLLVDEQGVIALDARVRVAQAEQSGVARLAIRPYPHELEEQIEFLGREIVLRPIRPEDEPQHARFLAAVEPQDLHLRFFHVVRAFAHTQLARFTQIDYDREMAFIATAPANGESETLGVVRAISDPDGARAEFAILIRSDVKGRGLGAVLMKKVIGYCRERKIGELVGDVLATNTRMLALARDLGFEVTAGEDPSVVRTKLVLAGAATT
ncbi:MAG: bifunctional acetate--CoA ligase family protein/GNAT family N-acetyltransferase [Burkholderiaceae bacterium]